MIFSPQKHKSKNKNKNINDRSKHIHTNTTLANIEIKTYWKLHIVFTDSQDIHIYLKYHKQNKINAASDRQLETQHFFIFF